MPQKPTKSGEAKPSDAPEPVEPVEPAAQHLHDETKRPIKAPIGGVPQNLPKQYPGKGLKHFAGQMQGKGRNFRHQGR